MKKFKDYVADKLALEQASQSLNYTNLGYPPWAKTANGQYFLDANGKINFVASGRRGIMDVGSFKDVYNQFFANDITPEKASELTKKYADYMVTSVNAAPQATHQPPDFYQDKSSTWSSDETGATYSIKGQKGTASPDQMQDAFSKLKGP